MQLESMRREKRLLRDTTKCTQDWTLEKETKRTMPSDAGTFYDPPGVVRPVPSHRSGEKKVVFSGSSEFCLEHIAERHRGDGHWTSLEFD